MKARSCARSAIASMALLIWSCTPERGFVLSVKNSSGARLNNLTVRWATGFADVGNLYNGAEDMQLDNPLPVPSAVTFGWDDARATVHEVVSTVEVERQDRRRVFLYFTILPDERVQGRLSYEMSK